MTDGSATGAPDPLGVAAPGDATEARAEVSGLAAAAGAAMAAPVDPALLAREAADEERDERVGLILSGWRLDVLLGEGRTARVYAASSQAGQRAAVKVMNRHFRGDERIRRRLFREANNARRAEHPGVTAILDNDVTHAGEPYIVMERLYGRDLNRLRKLVGGPIPEREALAVAIELCDLLSHCHERGIVHRNLAPFNVYVTVDGDVKVFDLGSAFVEQDSAEQTLQSLATDLHGYIAPELLASARAFGDATADVWSAGAILTSILADTDIADSTASAVWHQLDPEEPPPGAIPYASLPQPLRTLRGDVSPDVAAIVDQAMARDPAARFRSATELRDALVAALEIRDPEAAHSAEARTERLAAFMRRFYDSREELEKEETGAWRSAEVLRELFRLVENVLYSARRHGWDHAETDVRLQYLVERVLAAVADDPDGIFWVVKPYSFEYRGEAFWQPEPPFDALTYNVFDAGFRKMHLLPGLGEAEALEFLRWLTLDPDDDLAIEDDLATVFWGHEFVHVRCELVSAVVLQDVEDYEQLDRELQEMEADAIRHLRSTITSRLTGRYDDSGAHPEAPGEQADYVVARSPLLEMDPALLDGLGDAMHHVMPMWRGRLAQIVAAAIPDSLRRGDPSMVFEPYDQFVKDALANNAYTDALELFGAISERLDDPRILARLARPFTVESRFVKLMRVIVPRNERIVYGPELDFLADRLGRLLQHVPADQTPTVIEALARCHDRTILGLLLDFVELHAGGFQHPLGELLRSVPPLLGSNIIAILTQHLSPDTIDALEYAFESEHPKIRVEAAEVLARYSPRRAHRELRLLIRHEEPQIRQRAVEAIGRNKLTMAAEELLARLDEKDFHDLPIGERRALMWTVCRITEEKGEAALAQLVAGHGIVANEERDASRLAAVEILSELAITEESIEALEAAARKRWWNSKELQAAARQALPIVSARVADLDAELAARGRTGEEA